MEDYRQNPDLWNNPGGHSNRECKWWKRHPGLVPSRIQ